MKIVLAICGKAGSGKDAFASTLIEKGFVPIKFASTLEVIRYTVPIHEHGVSYGWCFERRGRHWRRSISAATDAIYRTDLCNSDYKKNFHR
jgi:septin family protein